MSVKKIFVLVVLFVVPLTVYLLLSTGVNNFSKLPVLTENINDVDGLRSFEGDRVFLKDNISILCFFGSDLEHRKGNAFNLNQKIYKRFQEFNTFQFVVVLPADTEEKARKLKQELGAFTDVRKWNFLFATPQQLQELFASLQTNHELDENYGTSYVFIVDKMLKLRGGTQKDSGEPKYGYDASAVDDLHNNMVDDVKVILAEYRLALKKNNAGRKI